MSTVNPLDYSEPLKCDTHCNYCGYCWGIDMIDKIFHLKLLLPTFPDQVKNGCRATSSSKNYVKISKISQGNMARC